MTLRRCVATAAVIAGLAACSSSDDTTTAAEPDDGSIVAQVASYELVADRDQRFIVGMFDEELGMLSYGAIDLTFRYLGTAQEQADEPRPGLSTTATFVPVPGSSDQPDAEPQFTSPSQARGVYGAEDVRFDEPGFWQVQVDFQAGGEARGAAASFEVGDESHVPVVGDPAPRTENLLPGDPTAPADAVDSRANDDDGTVPDPELHQQTVADAIAAGRPVMVVVSTPVYCVSRFCGPITDTIQQLAGEYSDEMGFVHIEVYKDFEANTVNKAAAEWIWPDQQGEPAEPWVFLVDDNGVVVERWDNVASEDSLRAAVEAVTGGGR